MSTTVEPIITTAHAPAPTRTDSPEAGDFRLLLRWLTAMLIIAAALAACVWTRMAVRQTALELDVARSALARAEIQHERLLVERSLLRDPGRLTDSAGALGLVPPTATISMTEAASQ